MILEYSKWAYLAVVIGVAMFLIPLALIAYLYLSVFEQQQGETQCKLAVL